jgi:FkbM family methyltransferase
MKTKPGNSSSLVYNSLVHTYTKCNRLGGKFSRLWWKAWNRACSRYQGPVRTRIHGREVVINFGNTYPLNSRSFPAYNSPLVELIYQANAAKRGSIVYVDVGAATGDSILLVHANCPEMIGVTYCIDGDQEFFSYLERNVAHIPGVKLRKTLLSASDKKVKSLVRTHGGTASAQGDDVNDAVTLDSILSLDSVNSVDVLKIDVDGFDGQILLGAEGLLTRDQPAVIFEWHPILCKQTGNNWTDHFTALLPFGYETFIWYTKFGEFSHFAHGFDPDGIDMLAEFCFNSKVHHDLHYDVIALHKDSPILAGDLADLNYATHRPSRY